MDNRKAYGQVTALGTKLGEKARSAPDLLDRLRAAPDLASFRQLVRQETAALLPPALLDAFLEEVLGEADWTQWRARLLIQAKMVRDGGRPAAGHEAGKGVGRP